MYILSAAVIGCVYIIHEGLLTDVDWSRLQNELTPSTFINLYDNSTKEYKEFNWADVEKDMSKAIARANLEDTRGEPNDYIKSCFYILYMYRNAIKDIRKYYSIRQLYKGTVEYEVGYLTYEIIRRYQNIVEIYNLMNNLYMSAKHYNSSHFRYDRAPAAFVFLLYTDILKLSTSIIHLCNMLHETDRKYAMPREGVFDDYPYSPGPGDDVNEIASQVAQYREARAQFFKRREKEKRKKQRMLRKIRKTQYLHYGVNRSIKYTLKPRSYWELDYGWSIEDW